jgi:hypothetical protein
MIVNSYKPQNLCWKPSKPVSAREIAAHMRARGCVGAVDVLDGDDRYVIGLADARVSARRRWTKVGAVVMTDGTTRDAFEWVKA